MADGNWSWTGQNPKVFDSNPGVQRFFCAKCGTPIAYRADQFPGEIHFYTSSLEDTSGFEPLGHVNHAERVSWHKIADSLPRWPHFAGSGPTED